MNTGEIYNKFKVQKNSERIAKEKTIEELIKLLPEAKYVLEMGGGLGTLSYTVLVKSNAEIDIYEPIEYYRGRLRENIGIYDHRYSIIDSYQELPPRKEYDLLIVDGGSENLRTVFLIIFYLENLKYIIVDGHRLGQRAFIKEALKYRYIYETNNYGKGIVFELKREKFPIKRWWCYLRNRVKPKSEIQIEPDSLL